MEPVNVCAQRRLGEGNRHLTEHIGTVPLEQLVSPHRHRHQQVAPRSAVGADIALAADADALAVVDTGRNLN